jgi:hypothetical protein
VLKIVNLTSNLKNLHTLKLREMKMKQNILYAKLLTSVAKKGSYDLEAHLFFSLMQTHTHTHSNLAELLIEEVTEYLE